MKKERIEYTTNGRKIVILSNRQYRKWELEHLEEVFPELSKEEVERIKKEEASNSFLKKEWDEFLYKIRGIVSHFRLWRMGKGRVRK